MAAYRISSNVNRYLINSLNQLEDIKICPYEVLTNRTTRYAFNVIIHYDYL